MNCTTSASASSQKWDMSTPQPCRSRTQALAWQQSSAGRFSSPSLGKGGNWHVFEAHTEDGQAERITLNMAWTAVSPMPEELTGYYNHGPGAIQEAISVLIAPSLPCRGLRRLDWVHLQRTANVGSLLCVPVMASERVLGVLSVASEHALGVCRYASVFRFPSMGVRHCRFRKECA